MRVARSGEDPSTATRRHILLDDFRIPGNICASIRQHYENHKMMSGDILVVNGTSKVDESVELGKSLRIPQQTTAN
jgi:hypothetical protein